MGGDDCDDAVGWDQVGVTKGDEQCRPRQGVDTVLRRGRVVPGPGPAGAHALRCKYTNNDGRNRDRGRWSGGGGGAGGGFGLTSFGDGGVGGGRMCLCSYPGKEGVVPTRTTPSPPLSPPLLLMLMPFFCVGIERARSLIHSHTRTRARTHIHRYQVSWILPGILLGRSK